MTPLKLHQIVFGDERFPECAKAYLCSFGDTPKTEHETLQSLSQFLQSFGIAFHQNTPNAQVEILACLAYLEVWLEEDYRFGKNPATDELNVFYHTSLLELFK